LLHWDASCAPTSCTTFKQAMSMLPSLPQSTPSPTTMPAGPRDQAQLLAALGNRRATYRGDVLGALLQGIGALVGGVLLLLAGIGLLVNGFIGGLIVLLVFSGALLVLLGPLLLYQATRSFGAQVTVYAHGLTLRRREVDVLRWDELAQLITYPLPHQLTTSPSAQRTRRRQDAPNATPATTMPPTMIIRYVVVTRAGHRFSLVGYRRLPELAATIEREIGARLYPQWVMTYRAGAPIPCGPWWIHRVGMTAGRLTLPWTALLDARIERDLVRLTWRPLPQQPLPPRATAPTDAAAIAADQPVVWLAPVAQVPNVRLALRLIADCRAGAI